MTIPIQTPQIGPTAVVPRGPNFLDIVIGAIQKRQELDQAREDLKRKREQFELNAKLAGTQIQGMELDNERKKRDFKEQELTLTARDEALQLYTGNLPQLHNPQGIGEVIARIKDPRVAAEFYSLLQTGAQATNAATPDYQFRDVPGQTPTGQEVVGFDPQNPTQPKRTGVAATAPQTEQRRAVVTTEREKASAAVGAIRANVAITRQEATDPTITQRIARKVAKRKSIIQGIVRRVTGTSPEEANFLAEQEIEKSMTPEELDVYVGQKQFLGAVLPGLAGKAVTGREWLIQAPVFFSMGATTPKVTAARASARNARIRSFIAESGDAFTERIPELQDVDLSPYGLGRVTLPDSTVHDITPGRARFHAKFLRTTPGDTTVVRP